MSEPAAAPDGPPTHGYAHNRGESGRPSTVMRITAEGRVREAIATVEDPEIPIALVDLGVVREVLLERDRRNGVRVRLVLAPTRLGCPALGEIGRRLSAAASAIPGVVAVRVEWRPRAWSPSDVSKRGQAALRAAGYTLAAVSQRCPYCGSSQAEPLGVFGGSVCRQSLVCSDCGSPYEALRSAACTAGALRAPTEHLAEPVTRPATAAAG